MSRPIFVVLFLAFALQVSQAQLSSHGAPASVVSPSANGGQTGVPASVVSPTTRNPGVHPIARPTLHVHGPARKFGSHAHQQVFVPVPLFYPIYGDGGYPSVADPYTPDPSAPAAADQAPAQSADQNQSNSSDDQLRAAYLQGARDALTQQNGGRYGEHYLDSRERKQQADSDAAEEERASAKQNSDFSMVPIEDKSPATVFIFKDGHQFETKNYAIMGGTLFDFSGNTLKKIKLDDLDSGATLKANDDRGVTVKLQ